MKKIISFVLVIIMSLCICSCNKATNEEDVWENAIYTEDTEIGSGKNAVMVEVSAKGKSVTLTVHSDKTNLGEVLTDNGIVEGEQGAYGLYIKKVNGITADYDINQCYWGINKNGEGVMTGIDGVEFKNGEHYELVYTSMNE